MHPLHGSFLCMPFPFLLNYFSNGRWIHADPFFNGSSANMDLATEDATTLRRG